MTISLNVNGQEHMVDADPATPLLYVLREDLQLNAAKFGCGHGSMRICTVMVDNSAVFSCLLPIAALAGRKVVTVEGLGSTEKPGAIQQAFIDEQAAQCGYCIAGMIMRAQSLLQKNSSPTDDEIRSHMQPNLCRCGTHMRILRAVRRAADAMKSAQAGGKAASLDGGAR